MEPETLLYIGGIADGERRLTKHQKTMVTRFVGKSRLIEGMMDYLTAKQDCIAEDLYRLERICGPKREFAVMVLDSMDADNMIEALISKYPAPKDDD